MGQSSFEKWKLDGFDLKTLLGKYCGYGYMADWYDHICNMRIDGKGGGDGSIVFMLFVNGQKWINKSCKVVRGVRGTEKEREKTDFCTHKHKKHKFFTLPKVVRTSWRLSKSCCYMFFRIPRVFFVCKYGKNIESFLLHYPCIMIYHFINCNCEHDSRASRSFSSHFPSSISTLLTTHARSDQMKKISSIASICTTQMKYVRNKINYIVHNYLCISSACGHKHDFVTQKYCCLMHNIVR